MFGILFLLLIFILLLLGAFFFFTPNNQLPQERNINWEEHHQPKETEKDWFAPRKWLTDVEIDWAVNQLAKNDKYKVLPAYQFHYVQESNKEEADAHLAFQELLSSINEQSKELVFIPVNNPNFHWSLLVYEVKTKTFEYYDTLNGANDQYIQLLVNQLLVCLLWPWQSNQNHLILQHDINQNNSWDCGVAVISLIKRIQENYQGILKNLELGDFNFKQEREKLRAIYLKENGE